MRRRWILIAAGAGGLAVVGLVLAVNGSSGGSSRFTLGGPVARAAARTARLPGERMSLSGTIEAQGDSVTMRGTGVFDWRSGLGRTRIVISGGGADETLSEITEGTTAETMTLFIQLPDMSLN